MLTRPPRASLRAGCALIALVALPVAAEEPGDPQASAPPPQNRPVVEAIEAEDEILVAGDRPIAESEEAALAFQRDSKSLVTVVSSDAIGRLPDQNIGQAISRLPGIAVQRDQGQPRYVSVRGAPNRWTTISVDGINIVSPEGRQTRFDSVPSQVASRVVVEKAITPASSGETIAGNVDIITRSPFDYDGFYVAAEGGAGINDLGGKAVFQGGLVLSDTFDLGEGKLGLLLSGSYYQRGMQTDNFENDWEVVSQDRRPGSEGNVWAREIENKFYRLTRKNWSTTGRIEWQPNPQNQVFFTSIYSIFTDDEYRDNYRLDTDDQQSRVPNSTLPCPVPPPTLPPPNTTGYADVCIGNTPFDGTVYGIDFDARFRSTAYRQSIWTSTWGGNHDLDDWSIQWRGNYTRSKDDGSVPYLMTYTQPGFGTNGVGAVNRVTTTYQLRELSQFYTLYRTLRAPNGQLSRGAPVEQFQDFPNDLSSITSTEAVATTDAWTGLVNVSRETQFLGNTVLSAGFQFDQRSKVNEVAQLELSGTANIAAAGIPTKLADITAGGPPYNGKLPLGYSFTPFNPATAQGFLEKAQAVRQYLPVLADGYEVTERALAGYVMATTTFDWGNLVWGVRVESLKNTGEGLAFIGSSAPVPVETESSQLFPLPSVQLNWNVADDQIIRVSLNTGAARPDYDVLRPSFIVDDGDDLIEGGNPFAVPERSVGLDLYWEWYIQPRGYFSLGVFTKKLRDVLFEAETVFGSDILNTPGVDRSDYAYVTTLNGGNGYLFGFEAAAAAQIDAFVPGDKWWGGFGVQANVTVTSSNANTPDGRSVPLPGASPLIYNLGFYYEKYGISARVAYQFRSAFLSELGGPDTGGDLYWADDGELDIGIRYGISKYLEVFFNGSNLTDAPGRRYAGIPQRTLEYEKFGRIFMAGFRFTR